MDRRPRAALAACALLAAGLPGALPAVAAEGPPTARGTDLACPPGGHPDDGLRDVASLTDVHEPAVDCVAWWDVAAGRTDGTFGPGVAVTRGQMATFVARLVGPEHLPSSPPDAFDDDEGSVHEAAADALAAAGVVSGTGARTFSPDGLVTRGQMATFLARAVAVRAGQPLPATQDWFADDDGSVHEENVDRVAEAGVTGGRPDGTYGPLGDVSRAQMASFLARTLDLFVELDLAEPPVGAGADTYPGEAPGVHGGRDWAVYLAVSDDPDAPELDEARSALVERGFTPTGGSLGCDQGAAEGLGIAPDPERTYYAVAAYVETEGDAEQFVFAFEPEVVGVVEVTTFCLD